MRGRNQRNYLDVDRAADGTRHPIDGQSDATASAEEVDRRCPGDDSDQERIANRAGDNVCREERPRRVGVHRGECQQRAAHNHQPQCGEYPRAITVSHGAG